MRIHRLGITLALLIALLPALPAAAVAATLYVDNGVACDDNTVDSSVTPYCTIQAAVNDAAADDIVQIAGGTYTGSSVYVVDLSGQSKNLTFNGAGEGVTIVDGQNTRPGFRFTGTATYTVNDVTIQNGNSSGSGGGLISQDSGTVVNLNSVTVTNSVSTAAAGGAYVGSGATLNLDMVTFDNTDSGNHAGAIFVNAGTLYMENSTISNSDATLQGGAISAIGTGVDVDIVESVLSMNSSQTNGGAINLDSTGGTLDMNGVMVIDNDGVDGGGGLYVDAGTVTITNSYFSLNEASGSGSHGGAIMTDTGSAATITIRDTTISGNTADGFGGGLFLPTFQANTFNIYNVTLAANTATNGSGGGLWANTATAKPTIRNTIIADNTAGTASPDCNQFTSNDYNLIEDVTGCTITGTTTNNITGVDPKLMPLTFFDGGDSWPDTWAHPLSHDSPARDAGDPTTPGTNADACATADQRGATRSVFDCDIGAFEIIPTVDRLFGADRFATAADIAEEYWPTSDTVIIANGLGFPDALAGANLYGEGAPLLLVTSSTPIPAATVAQLDRLTPSTIFVLGGTAVVDSNVETALSGWGSVTRLSGADRYSTAVAITTHAFPGQVSTLFIASGANFPDALSAGAAAAHVGGALLITDPNSLPASVSAEITRLNPTDIYIIGGSGAVADGVATAIDGVGPTPVRVFGADRYSTAVAVSQTFFTTSDKVFVATGANYPDALAGTQAAALNDAPMLLIPSSSVPAAVSTEIGRLKATTVIVLGGTGVIDGTAFGALEAIVGL